jgi:hypothetical protein
MSFNLHFSVRVIYTLRNVSESTYFEDEHKIRLLLEDSPLYFC